MKSKTKISIVKISETESWFFEKINKIGKPPARLTNKRCKLAISEMKQRISLQTLMTSKDNKGIL